MKKVFLGIRLAAIVGLAVALFWWKCGNPVDLVRFLFGDIVQDYASRVPFNATAWKDAAEQDSDDPVRLRMVDDLLWRHRLVGMTRGEIDHLLGVPPKTAYFKGYDYVYWLGPERRFISIDSEWLAIKFEQGRVAEASIVRD